MPDLPPGFRLATGSPPSGSPPAISGPAPGGRSSAAPLPTGFRPLPEGFRPATVPTDLLPSDVLNEQRVTSAERSQLNTLAPNPASAVDWLRRRGYDARLDAEGEIAVRKPGQPRYGRVEPTGFLAGEGFGGKLAELARDLGPDALNEYLSALAMGKGAALGAGAGSSAGPVGTVLGGVGGAAAGSTAAEAARLAAAKAAGFELGGVGGVAQNLGEEALAGGLGELGGRAVIGAAKGAASLARKGLGAALRAPGNPTIAQALQLPERRFTAAEAGQEARTALAASREAHLTTQLERAPLAEDLRVAQAHQAGTQAELIAAQNEAAAANTAALEDDVGRAFEAIARGKQLSAKPELPATVSRAETTVTKTAASPHFNFPAELARPDYGFRADVLQTNPGLVEILNHHLGPEYAPTLIDAATGKIAINPATGKVIARGSISMAQRAARGGALAAEKGAEWTTEKTTALARDIADYLLNHPNLGTAAPDVLEQLTRTAHGIYTPGGVTTTANTLKTVLSGRMLTPRLHAAQLAHNLAREETAASAAAFKQSGTAAAESARNLKEAQALHSGALASERMLYRESKPLTGRSTMGRVIATGIGSHFGPGGAIAGAIAPELQAAIAAPLRKGAAAVGRALERPRPRALQRLSRLRRTGPYARAAATQTLKPHR